MLLNITKIDHINNYKEHSKTYYTLTPFLGRVGTLIYKSARYHTSTVVGIYTPAYSKHM